MPAKEHLIGVPVAANRFTVVVRALSAPWQACATNPRLFSLLQGQICAANQLFLIKLMVNSKVFAQATGLAGSVGADLSSVPGALAGAFSSHLHPDGRRRNKPWSAFARSGSAPVDSWRWSLRAAGSAAGQCKARAWIRDTQLHGDALRYRAMAQGVASLRKALLNLPSLAEFARTAPACKP